MKKKKVSLPINMLPAFEVLAISKVKAMNLTDEAEIEKVIRETIQEMGEEAYLMSFTPSGELARNPFSPKIAQSFYENFPDVFGVRGWFTKMLKGKSEEFIVTKERRFKTALVNLTQLYLELGMGKKTRGKKTGEFTDFSYPVNVNNETTEEDYKKLVQVEKNRYTRLYIATLLLKSITQILNISASQIQASLENNDLWNLDGARSHTEAFKRLTNPNNRKSFIDNIKKMINVKVDEL